MSFILDALKKSETDRQRQSGPALFEVKVAPPRTGLPLWAVAIVVLLGVNLVIVAWVLFRHPGQPTVEVAPVPVRGVVPASAVSPGSQVSVPLLAATAPAQGPPAPGVVNGPPVASSGQPGSSPQTAGTTQPGSNSPTPASGPSTWPGAPRPGNPATDTSGNPDDYEPATEAAPAPFNARVRRSTDSGLQLYQDAAAAPGAGLPELRLDLHVFAARPQERFVMINMRKLHEGDSLSGGVRVESITPDGAVLSHNGARFLLPRD
jgi:general secretion pathway protein B